MLYVIVMRVQYRFPLPLSLMYFVFKQKTAYEMRISNWSSDVCSSDLLRAFDRRSEGPARHVAVERAQARGREQSVHDDPPQEYRPLVRPPLGQSDLRLWLRQPQLRQCGDQSAGTDRALLYLGRRCRGRRRDPDRKSVE